MKRQEDFIPLGIAAMIPGMQLMLDLMQQQLDEYRHELDQVQQNGQPNRFAKAGKARWAGMTAAERSAEGHRMRNKQPKNPTMTSYWAQMTPAERSQEVKRRMAMRKPVVKLHPRDAAHPEHKKWIAKMRKVNTENWARLTPAERKRRTEAMVAGREKKKSA